MDEQTSFASSKMKKDQITSTPTSPSRRCQAARAITRRVVILGGLCFSAYTLIKLFNNDAAGDIFTSPHHPHTIQEREKFFLSIPNTESALESSRAYATHSHIAGSSEDLLDAKALLHLFQDEFHIPKPVHLPVYKAGSEESRNATLSLTSRHGHHGSSRPTAWIDTYYPVMNRGISQNLEIIGEDGTVEWVADLQEDGDPGDVDAHKNRLSVQPFHGYGADGDVTGKLVYANYGMKEDYDQLVAQGVNLTGKVVIARYGGPARGLKVKGAQELGAVGVLLYSDTRDDGYVTVENGYLPYPAGPARNPTAIERGSLADIGAMAGDPTTPGYPSYEDAERIEPFAIPKIPSLPLSWGNAQRLLSEIGDVYVVDESGKKVLSGKESGRDIHLVNKVDVKVIPIWNTMAAIPGHIRDEVVVMGCHRDAWVMGAADPTSGTVSLHEIVRGFGALLRTGWKPLRTVVIASWDAEEYALIGSTEWAEDFAPWISENVVSYLNLDTSVAGSTFSSAASPSLAHLIRGAAQDLPHPSGTPGKTLWDAKDDEGPYKGVLAGSISKLNVSVIDEDFLDAYNNNKKKKKALIQNQNQKGSDHNTEVFALGSGSDFTAFLQRLGVASTQVGFGPSASDAVYHYHSIYDSQAWMERYGDVGSVKHVAVAKLLGLMALRVADSVLLPLNTTQYALELDDYLASVEALLPASSSSDDNKKVVFPTLKKSIHKVHEASLALDKEKKEAEEDFNKLVRHLPWHRRRANVTVDSSDNHSSCFASRVLGFVNRMFGVSTRLEMAAERSGMTFGNGGGVGDAGDRPWLEFFDENVDVDEAEKALVQQLDLSGASNSAYTLTTDSTASTTSTDSTTLPFPIRRFIEAARRLRRVNKKLMMFERGFLSEEGIKGREWFKHLGVAPGKWLGYGATTFPGLTEAVEFEKDEKLIHHEARRLEELLDKLAEAIEV